MVIPELQNQRKILWIQRGALDRGLPETSHPIRAISPYKGSCHPTKGHFTLFRIISPYKGPLQHTRNHSLYQGHLTLQMVILPYQGHLTLLESSHPTRVPGHLTL